MSYGVSAASLDRMKDRGWTTMGAFAFSTSSPPGASVGGDLFWKEVGELIKKDPASAELSGLRRLHYEAWITTSADMKCRLERRDDDPPRKLPAVEREERKERLQAKLGIGLKIRGEYEPAHCLVDQAVEIAECDSVKRIPLEKCVSRGQELQGEKVDKYVQPDKSGYLRMTSGRTGESADASDLMSVQNCLVRRGVALEGAGVLSYEVHALLAQEFLDAAQTKLTAGFARPSMEQLISWDVEVWRRASELAGATVRERPVHVHWMPLLRVLSMSLALLSFCFQELWQAVRVVRVRRLKQGSGRWRTSSRGSSK